MAKGRRQIISPQIFKQVKAACCVYFYPTFVAGEQILLVCAVLENMESLLEPEEMPLASLSQLLWQPLPI